MTPEEKIWCEPSRREKAVRRFATPRIAASGRAGTIVRIAPVQPARLSQGRARLAIRTGRDRALGPRTGDEHAISRP